MRSVALVITAAAFLAVASPSWSNSNPETAAEEIPPPRVEGVFFDRPHEATLLFFNDKRKPVYLLRVTPEELTCKQGPEEEGIVRFSSKDGAVVEVQTGRGGKFVLNRSTNLFEVAVPEPPAEPALKLTRLEQAILDIANEERKNAGLQALTPDEKLFQIAREHSENMARQDWLGHVLDGKDPGRRARDVGYTALVTENAAWGHADAADVMRGWMTSPGHRANLLDSQATEVGIGQAVSPRTGPYYTMVFGIRRAR